VGDINAGTWLYSLGQGLDAKLTTLLHTRNNAVAMFKDVNTE
jgi:hypothetical protein